MRPSIDHGLLSPSGSMSKRARKAAMERERVRLFGAQGLQRTEPAQPTEREHDLRMAAELEDLARRGMKPKAHAKKAAELRSKWA